jgi:hypothetical protein
VGSCTRGTQPEALFPVSTTLLASKQLGQTPGLRAKASRILAGILETAIEAKKLYGMLVPVDPPLAVHVDGHTVWYALDLDPPSATILVVEPVSGGPGPAAPASGAPSI